jgi:ClpP class serine protease
MSALRNLNVSSAEALGVCVNSPGGYPSQSHIIATKLRSFADRNKLKLYTFATDEAASAGYAILCVGDEVYAHPSSLVGNIGVVFKRYSFSKGL